MPLVASGGYTGSSLWDFMAHNEPTSASPAASAQHAAEPSGLDADFDTRWAAWRARGDVHERAVRRRLLMLAPVAAVAAAILYSLMIR
jgi:hypothetical protein